MYSQEPAYFVIGEKELANTDVYSICQTENEILYVATNHGLFEYRHGKFTPIIGTDEQYGNSLFNLKLNNDGELFCGNLSGQIFKLVNGKLELYFELEKSKIGRQLMYEFDVNNHLIVGGRYTCLDVSEGKSKVLYEHKKGIQSLSKLIDGRIIVGLFRPDSIVTIQNGIVDITDVSEFIDSVAYSPYNNHRLQIDGKLFNAYANGTIGLLEHGNYINEVVPIKNERYFQFETGEVWALDHAIGARKIFIDDNLRIGSTERYFQNEFVSAVAKGKNNTLFFGTFNNGIIVVPNQATKKHNLIYDGAEMSGLTVDDNNNVFISTRDGQVLHYNESTVSIDKTNAQAVHKIYYAHGIDFGINTAYPSLLYNGMTMYSGRTRIGSIKDVWQVNATTALIATSGGIFKTCNPDGECSVLDDVKWTDVNSNRLKKLSAVSERCKSVAYDSQKDLMYVSTHYALLEFSNDGASKEIKYNEQKIICKDLLFYENKLWCATLNHGVLVFSNGKVHKTIDQSNGLGNNAVNKLELKNNRLFISHKNGFQILDLKSNKWTTLGTAEGIVNGSVNDFALSSDKLWMISDGQPLSLNLNNLPQKKTNLTVYIDSLIVSGRTIVKNDFRQFSHDQNQFSFYIDFRGIEYETEAKILYRIKGFEEEWNTIPPTTEIIEYKYLPPGKYAFEIKVQYRDSYSETKRHDFEITSPFWTTLPFYLLIGTGFGALILFLYLYQIRRMDKRNKERLEKQKIQTNLLETELRALRSQMNPHFIFNSLNSIQDLILQQDTDASYDYIVLFADLVRNTLNYSNKDFIPIEKEIEFLEVYLSLEKLRFEEDFNYEILFEGKEELSVPSLIVQPFIENALVHGLLHKSGQKKLTIEFEYSDKLICTITDNGVGRARAKEIQERQGNHHESFALDAIGKRLSILKEQYGKEVGYVIHDLYENDVPSGTQVVITMPYMNQF